MRYIGITTIVLVFVLLAAIYSFVIPLGEGPDEPGHASYVFFLARTLRLPDQRGNEVPGEGHQPPLAYALAAPLAAWLPLEQRQFDLPGNPRFTWAGPSAGSGQARELNAVAHGSREYWPWQGFVLAWHLARLVSVALGAATVVLTYLAARELNHKLQIANCKLLPEQSQFTIYNLQFSIALLAAALVAFNPQFLFVSALITNDALLTALSAAMLWLVARGDGRWAMGDRYSSIRHALGLGVILGLALIAKQSALLLLPVAALSVLIHGWRATQARCEGKKWRLVSSFHLVILSHMALFAVVTLLICGWWYVRNWQFYGDLFGLAVFQREFAAEPFDARSPAAWWAALAQLHASFWARFGWMNLPAPGWVIWLFGAIEVAAVAGWLAVIVGWFQARRRRLEDQKIRRQGDKETVRMSSSPSPCLPFSLSGGGRWALLALPLLALAWVVSFALTAGLVAWQGRLLFPALPAIAIILAIGLSSLAVGSRQSAAGSFVRGSYWLLASGSCLLALWLPFGVIRPAYAFHTLPERVALERIGTPAYGRLGLVGDPGAELRGWQLSGEARPGSTIDLGLIWHALGRQNRNWTVFVHLVGANEQIVVQHDAQPQAGAFPMKQWVAGDWVEDHHALELPASVPPGSYALRVGLYDPRTGRRAAVFDQKGKLVGDYAELGQIRIE